MKNKATIYIQTQTSSLLKNIIANIKHCEWIYNSHGMKKKNQFRKLAAMFSVGKTHRHRSMHTCEYSKNEIWPMVLVVYYLPLKLLQRLNEVAEDHELVVI